MISHRQLHRYRARLRAPLGVKIRCEIDDPTCRRAGTGHEIFWTVTGAKTFDFVTWSVKVRKS